MIGYFSAMFAEFMQEEFLRCFHLVFLRDVIAVLTNHANESNFYSVFALFSHTRYYTLFGAALEEYNEPRSGIGPETSFLPRKRSATELSRRSAQQN